MQDCVDRSRQSFLLVVQLSCHHQLCLMCMRKWIHFMWSQSGFEDVSSVEK